MLKVYQIDPPSWARKPEINLEEEFGEFEHQRLHMLRAVLLRQVQEIVEKYLGDESAQQEADGERGFPDITKMTGEYYIADESYHQYVKQCPPNRGQKSLWFSLMVRCLEKPFVENQQNFDYLGLEIHFKWDVETGQFIHYGDIDSSSI